MTDDPTPASEAEQTSGPDLSALRQSADEMEKHLESLQTTASTARAQLWGMVGLLIVILLIFGFSTSSRIKENFSGEKAAAAATKIAPELMPLVQRQTETLLTKVGPVYVQVVEDRLSEGGGELAEDTSKAFEGLPQQCFDDLQKVVDDSFKRVSDKVAPELGKAFPNLIEANVSDRLAEHFNITVFKNADILEDQLQDMFQQELDQMNDALESFQIPEAYAKKSNEELNFLMLHHMFLMLDDATTSYEEGAFFPLELASDTPKPAPRKAKKQPDASSPKEAADEGDAEKTSGEKQSAAESDKGSRRS